MTNFDFDNSFELLTGHACFPWQRRLFMEKLRKGDLPAAVNIPTGLGKTAVMALWLLARAEGASLPRRLVYVVDRRVVVDQATRFAEDLRENLAKELSLRAVRRGLGLDDRPLPISTLRGKYVDNREWLDDPSLPAVVIGTVDMVGSRLLFEGYGVSRRMRPYQAGLMGCDSLVLLDEAHLAGPFERLLKTVEEQQRAQDPVRGFAGLNADAKIIPAFRVLPLSATLANAAESAAFSLDDEDRQHEVVKQRIRAKKRLRVAPLEYPENKSTKSAGPDSVLVDGLAAEAWDVTKNQESETGRPVRMLVYCDKRAVAEKTAESLRKKAGGETPKPEVILFVGGRRVHEREEAARQLAEHGFIAGSKKPDVSAFVVATSAGEVGIDLDADHMVCDLVAWERMVQRLGRVNRRGEGVAEVTVIDQDKNRKLSDKDKKDAKLQAARDRHESARQLLNILPNANASPEAISHIVSENGDRAKAASTPMPLYPALTRPLIDAWAMTSLQEHTGRPEIGPWLRGWVENEEPQTAVLWRRWLPLRIEDGKVRLNNRDVKAFFESAPPRMAELLETETYQLADWLVKRAKKISHAKEKPEQSGDSDRGHGESDTAAEALIDKFLSVRNRDIPVAFCFHGDGKLAGALKLDDLKNASDLRETIAGKTLVINSRFGGLDNGLLNSAYDAFPPTIEDNWGMDVALEYGANAKAGTDRPQRTLEFTQADARTKADHAETAQAVMRVRPLHDDRRQSSDTDPASWQEALSVPYKVSPEGDASVWLVVEKAADAADEESRSLSKKEQLLDEHQKWVADEAAHIADSLGLPEEYRRVLIAAARYHDEGKRASRWQRAFNAPGDGDYGKTKGPFDWRALNGFRHEFQSVMDAEKNGIRGIDNPDHRNLLLHLIAAHHGRARPVIGVEGCDSIKPTVAARHGYKIAMRFAKLQKQWGPWGLAWWEALLRAADQRASKALESGVKSAGRTN